MADLTTYYGRYHNFEWKPHTLENGDTAYTWVNNECRVVLDWWSSDWPYVYGDEDNEDHYAESMGESLENSSGELWALSVVVDGTVSKDITGGGTVELRVRHVPSNELRLKIVYYIQDPWDCDPDWDYWTWFRFWTWVGKGFDHNCSQSSPCVDTEYIDEYCSTVKRDVYYYQTEMDEPANYRLEFWTDLPNVPNETIDVWLEDQTPDPLLEMDYCYVEDTVSGKTADEGETLSVTDDNHIKVHFRVTNHNSNDGHLWVYAIDADGYSIDATGKFYIDGNETLGGALINETLTSDEEIRLVVLKEVWDGKESVDLVGIYYLSVTIEPDIRVTYLQTYVDSTETIYWTEEDEFWLRVSMENGGGDGEATVQITYDGTIIDEFTTQISAGNTQTYNTSPYPAGTVPVGTWDICAEVVDQWSV